MSIILSEFLEKSYYFGGKRKKEGERMLGSGTSEPMFAGEGFWIFCFSFALYGTADFHLRICMAGMSTEDYFQAEYGGR